MFVFVIFSTLSFESPSHNSIAESPVATQPVQHILQDYRARSDSAGSYRSVGSYNSIPNSGDLFSTSPGPALDFVLVLPTCTVFSPVKM